MNRESDLSIHIMQTPGFGDSINVPKLKKGHLIFVEDVEMLYYIAKKGAGKSAALLEPGSVVEVHCVGANVQDQIRTEDVRPLSGISLRVGRIPLAVAIGWI